MSGVVTRKPLVGFATALIFFFLGLLLIQMETAPGALKGVVIWMFRILGGFLLFASLISLATACLGIWKRNKRRGGKSEG
jgi:hypothetical protein